MSRQLPVVWLCLLAAQAFAATVVRPIERKVVPAAPAQVQMSPALFQAATTFWLVGYTISARLDEASGTVSGSMQLRYQNITDDTLRSLRFHLYPNAFAGVGTTFNQEMERSGRYGLGLANASDRGWLKVSNVRADSTPATSSSGETHLEVLLPAPLLRGAWVIVELDFTTKLPHVFSELGRKGRNYLLCHWYPQVAGYVPGKGWLTDGYHLFGHSASALASYSVTLTVPEDLAAISNANGLGEGPASQPDTREWLRWPPGMRHGSRDSTKTMRLHASHVTDLVVVLGPDYVLAEDTVAGQHLNIFARYPVSYDWIQAIAQGRAMVAQYSESYGRGLPGPLTIVQASGLAPHDLSYRGLLLLSQRPIPATRVFEQALARLIATRWFCGLYSLDEISAPWTALGPAANAEMRYMEKAHGRSNLLDQPLLSTIFPGLGSRYYHRLYDYVAVTNSLLRPLSSPPQDFRDNFEFGSANVSHAGLLFHRAEEKLGSARYDSTLRYCSMNLWNYMPDPKHLAGPFSTTGVFDTAGQPLAAHLWQDPSAKRITMRPGIGLPSFDSYQFFCGPYVWYDNYHGLQLSGWVQGRRFVDAGPLHGRHQFNVSGAYFTKLQGWHTGFSYVTPLDFIDRRLRIFVAGDYSTVEAGARVNVTREFGPVFGQPRLLVDLGYRFLDLYDRKLRDTLAWDSSRISDIRLQLTRTFDSRRFNGTQRLYLAPGLNALGSDRDYFKASIEQTAFCRLNRKSGIALRGFAGGVHGDAPAQEQFYLSGGLVAYPDEPVSWGYQGMSSGQENWHYDGDANVRGFAGEYIHGRFAWGINVYLVPVKLIQPFFDLGSVGDSIAGRDLWKPRMDAGFRLRLGPLYADFPAWRFDSSTGKSEFAFRWTLGLKISGLLGGI